MKKLSMLALLLFGFCIWPSKAQAPDVPAYMFEHVKGGDYYVDLYKTVYQGCELFIAITSGVHENIVAITTGRGCK